MTTTSLVKKIASKMKKSRWTLGIAESCTGGQISAALTAIPGASKYFEGSIVSYADEIKHALLGVSQSTLQSQGAVSSQTAHQMARGARHTLDCNWSLSVTGLAGPSGGTKKKPVGLVFFAVVGPHFVLVEKKIFSGNRKQIQQKSVQHALTLLLKSLTQKPKGRSQWHNK